MICFSGGFGWFGFRFGLDGLIFFSAICYLDITKVVEILHTGLSHKDKMIQEVLDNLAYLVLGLVCSVCFFLSYIPISAISSRNLIVYKVKLYYLISRLQLTTVLEHLVWFSLAFCSTICLIV